MSSVRGLLRQTLDNLEAKDFKRFKALLGDQNMFPQGTLKNTVTDVDDVVNLMVQAFPDQEATRIVLAILSDMKQNCLAAALKQKLDSNLVKGNLKRPRDKNSCEKKLAIKRRHSSVRHELQSLLTKRFCRVHDRIVWDLEDIYTELYIVKGRNGWVNNTHEVIQIESCPNSGEGQSVNLANMFQIYSHESRPVSKVLTVGIAGSGKTIAVQKFVMDWAERKRNQDIDLVFVLLFRELNTRKCQRYSLVDLLLHYHPGLNELANTPEFKEGKILFIFDGLDESNLVLDFDRCDVDKPTLKSSVDMVVASLFQGILLPSALVWVTSRPAAANLIRHFHLETEVRGFNDPQKDEYFHKVIKDEEQAKKIIAHVKSKRSLHIMCHIPVFCSITASVLGEMLNSQSKERLPQTLTEMYAYYVAFQIKQINVKYMKNQEELSPEAKQGLLVKLGELAFSHLAENKFIFYEEDLRACEIDVTKASVHSGLCTQIFDVDSYCTDENVYSFVHLSIQEFLAALYVLHTYTAKRENVLVENCLWKRIEWKFWRSRFDLYKVAVDKAVHSQKGQWDLFLRFLLGLAPVVERKGVLSKLLPKLNDGKVCGDKTTDYIKRKIREELSPDRIINLFHCLSELGDDSLVEEINRFRSTGVDGWNLTPAQCSALAYLLLMSVEDLEEFDLKNYLRSEEGLYRMLPVVKVSKSVWLNECYLSKVSCDRVASVLQGTPSLLKELNMSDNDLRDEGVELICAGLQNPNCKLETLKLSGCLVTEKGCTFLTSALKSNPSYLKELDLSYNHFGESGVGALTERQKDAGCKLEIFNYSCGGKIRMKPGLQKYAHELTLDPNTAHRQLRLSDRNKRVSWIENNEPYPDHPDRFEVLQQVLCSQGLVEERFYWEVEYTGEVHVGVTYKYDNKDSEFSSTVIGHNAMSWSLERSKGEYITWHVDKIKAIPYSLSGQQRIGVYLDCRAGTLSFYAVQSNTSTHLYTFSSNDFTKPLYPAFWLNWEASLNICSIT